MDKKETLDRIASIGLIAVIRGPSPESTLHLVQALIDGGVRGIEITYTTPEAPKIVQTLHAMHNDDILLGMGTLTEPKHAAEALDAGARFIVSPYLDEKLSAAMVDTGLAVMIGGFTPSEIVASYRSGSDIVKLFPGSLGRPGYLKALRGPFPDIPFMPTGGVSPENVAEWFQAGAVAVGAGSSLCPKAWIAQCRFEEITARAQTFVQMIERGRVEM
jgi:2-dehydro-3-deoxyphosphogluconate aldolase/(4S)-4-hydroxy-2-oxoglutarate aldolase